MTAGDVPPQELTAAIQRARAWLDEPGPAAPLEPEGHLPGDMQRAILRQLGPIPMLVDPALDPEKHRPDLAETLRREGGCLGAPPGAVLVDPTEGISAQLDRLRALDAPQGAWQHLEDELADLEARGPVQLSWHEVFHLPTAIADWPGLERSARLAAMCAASVLPQWDAAHPGDDRVRALASTIRPSLAWARDRLDLRDELEQASYEDIPATDALRAVVLAHDRVTQNPARVEQTELEYLSAFAWQHGPAELCNGIDEPTARATAWYGWWVDVAVPAAFVRSSTTAPSH